MSGTPKAHRKRDESKVDAASIVWPQEHETALKNAVIEYGEGSFDRIAQAMVKYGRTENECRAHWKELHHVVKSARTKADDELLRSVVERSGTRKWPQIAEHIPRRNPKQCRERWINNLDSSVPKAAWTPEEDRKLIEEQRRIGNRWSRLAKLLPGRSDNAVKQRWYSMMNKDDDDEDADDDEVEDEDDADAVSASGNESTGPASAAGKRAAGTPGTTLRPRRRTPLVALMERSRGPGDKLASERPPIVDLKQFAAANVGLLHGRELIDSAREGCIVLGCPNGVHPVCEQHECCELCKNPFAQHCFTDDLGGPDSRTLVRALYAAAFESRPDSSLDALWNSIKDRYYSVAAWARETLADELVSTDVSDQSLVVQNQSFVEAVQALAEYLRGTGSTGAHTDEKDSGDTAYVSTGRLSQDRLEAAVAKFCADPVGRPLLVGRNFKHMPSQKWSHVSMQKLKFDLHRQSGDLLLISCGSDTAHAVAVAELVRQVGNFIDFHNLGAHLVHTSDGLGDFVAGRTHAPDVAVAHRPAAAGAVVPTSLIVEVEVGHRSGPQVIRQLRAYAQAPVCAYLLAIKVYKRNAAGNWAGAAVLWQANAPIMVGAWSFGPRDVPQIDKARYRTGAPPALAPATVAQIPFVHTPVGALSITVPANNVIANHAAQPALSALIQTAAVAEVVAPGFVAGQLTIDLAKIRTVLQNHLP